jgi:hypothetical protein
VNKSKHSRYIDLRNKKFGKLILIEWVSAGRWRAHCDCGREVIVWTSNLYRRRTRSCGCLQKALTSKRSRRNIKHGEAVGGVTSPEYAVWAAMRARCRSPSHPLFYRYGARGIQVAKRWEKFEYFLADMGRRPSSKHSIERKDVNGNYEPSNCVWATIQQQNRNTTRNRRITINGETRVLVDWLQKVGINSSTFYQRLRRGFTEVEAITRPRERGGRKSLPRVK